MKTIREILLERHRAIEPKLDAIRQEALRELEGARTFLSAAVDQRMHGACYLPISRNTLLRTGMSALQSLRWHLAGLGAAWLAIALLNLDHTPTASSGIAQQHVPSPRQLLAA